MTCMSYLKVIVSLDDHTPLGSNWEPYDGCLLRQKVLVRGYGNVEAVKVEVIHLAFGSRVGGKRDG